MPYISLLKKLYQINKGGQPKYDLSNMRALSHSLGHPERQFSSIHVAGTNGKGSVSTKIAHALSISNRSLRVGLYTSPHISSFRERIRINGELISEEAVESILTDLMERAESLHVRLTFFELTTLLAYCYFASQQVDFAVIETGIGGRLDATNIITPLASVITSISLDHTEILGADLPQIAKEKAGIIKPKVPVIIGPKIPEDLIVPHAEALKAPYLKVTKDCKTFDEENMATAAACLKLLDIPEEAVLEGCKARPPCRFEQVTCPPGLSAPPPKSIILDVAHNPDGFRQLFFALKAKFPHSSFRLVCGLSKGKDISGCVALMRKYGDAFHLIEAPHSRALPKDEIYQEFTRQGTDQARLFLAESLQSNLAKAIELSNRRKEVLVVCGSFFIMAPVRAYLGIVESTDPYELNELAIPGQTKETK